MENQYHPDFVSPPGETLREELAALKLSPLKLSFASGLTLETVLGVLDGSKAITEPVASALEYALNIPASFWLNREKLYRDKGEMK